MTSSKQGGGLAKMMEVFGERDYRLLWIGGAISNSGRWMQAIAIPFVLHELTGSGVWVGLGGFAAFLPMAIMSPLAGSLADRYPRRVLLLITQTLSAVAAAGLAVAWAAGVRSPGAYVALAAVGGVVNGLNLPAWQAFVSDLVPRRLLLNAITLNSAQFNAARAVGPALAGIVIGSLGPGWAFGLNAISYGAVLIALALISVSGAPKQTTREPVFTEFRSALHYARRRDGIVTAYLAVGVIGLLGFPIVSLAVLLARDVFEVSEQGFGLMVSMVGVGAVLVAPLVAIFGNRFDRSRLQLGSLLAYGTSIVLVAVSPSFVLALVGMAFIGGSHIVTASTLNTTIQLQVDESMRGKVLSIYLLSILLANPIGQLVLGAISDGVGVRVAIGGAGITLFVLTGWLQFSGRLASLDNDPIAMSEADVRPRRGVDVAPAAGR